ncbi:RING finger protein 17 like protein [Argiope bruennichi]|uniref:RING finger protein 17 like protein n=1 Tax=Argiope bruennichi TaxID=94029 RepID=A0A8T0EW51_ARGBR|nr:RING finger protein 17 like protein [Argiope bruennichi]
MREADLISELMEISERPLKSLEEMRFKVADFERNLASLKKDAESVIENPHLAVSAPAILKKFEEYKDIPCFLVPLTDESESRFNMNLDLESDFEESIKQIGKIHFEIKPRFALLPSSDLPKNFCTDIPESFMSKLKAAADTESVSDSFDTFSEDSLSTNTEHSSFQTSFKYRDYARMQPEKVLVSHIVDPSSFFIQRFSELHKLKTMSDAINKWCKGYESKKFKATELEPGSLYLIQYSKDKMWYRGRIKSVYKSDEDSNEEIGSKLPVKTENGKIVVKNKEQRALVYFIDYGNTEIVSLSQVKNIQPRFLSLPGIAKECSLVDIEPANKDKWSAESVRAFANFVDRKIVIMQVYEERNNVFAVDLCQCPDNDISSDVPVSIRDALVFLELAVFPSGTKHTHKKNKVNRDYMPPEPVHMNVNICAIVSHVNDPYNIYAQQMSTASYLSKLIVEMSETYNSEKIASLHSIYAPCVGMVCAAQFSVDKQWYRAKVIDLPGGSKVKVQYVDFGNTEVIHYKYLRKLFDKFFKLNIQAFPCKMAHITYSGTGWDQKAKEWLTKEISRRQLTLKSLGMIPGENKAEVLLYYTEDDIEICLNALMVEEGLALSTGPGSVTVRKRKEGFVNKAKSTPRTSDPVLNGHFIPPPRPLPGLDILEDEDFNDSRTISKRPQTATASKQESKKEESSVQSTKNKKYPSLACPLEESNHIEVMVSHVISPGSFYIRIAGDKEKKLMLLMDDLQKVYENLQGEIVECKVGKAYAVFCPKRKKWFRGTVMEKVNDSLVKVHYVDYGNTEDVEQKYLRKLEKRFVEDESFSLQCHLDDIIPAGGSSNWSHSACDIFKQLIAPHDSLLLACKGDITNDTKSLPVDLLFEHLIRGGALEPTKIEYVSVKEEIVKYGYALRTRRKSPSVTNNKVTEEKNKESEIVNSPVEISDVISIPNSVFSNETLQTDEPKSPVKEQNLPPEEPKFQWKPAVPPLESLFKGYVTNIGDDGSIHLYVSQNGTSQVETISKALQFKYGKLESDKCLKKAPSVGEACVAKFSLDNAWYRAEIVSVYPGPPVKVKVNFVDYGNNEIVPLSFIRTDLIMKDFPRQCLECVIFGIGDNPKFTWDKDLLTFLHTQLVDTEVSVEIQAAPDKKGRLQTLIRTTSGIDLSELLLSMGFDDPSENIESPEVCDAPSDTFTRALELRKGDIYPVCATLFPCKNIVYLQILKIPNPKDEFESMLNSTHDAFLQLIVLLQEKAESFLKLQEPMPGMPCCAKYSYMIIGTAVNLRKLESQFIGFPIQLHICELYGVKPTGEDLSPETKDMLLKVPNEKLFAKIMVPGKICQVELLIKTGDGEYKPALQVLAEKEPIVL